MKCERCNLIKKIVDFCIFPTMIIVCLTFLTGAYYERNIYYNLDDITLEVGEKLPNELDNYIKTLDNVNFSIETNAPLDEDGNTIDIGNFSYYLVYNDPIYKYSTLTNIKATITIIDTTKPIINVKDNLTFKYDSDISADDIASCFDLSECSLSLAEEIDTTNSGTKEVTIIATDKGNNTTSIKTSITIEEKPKPVVPVYYFYYSSSIEEMNLANNQKNSLLSEDEKNSLRYQIANYAQQFIGNPYVYGGTSLTNGTDCSGFTMSVYASFGYRLPRVATSQIYIGIDIPESQLQPGDLVVYHYGHVGIYVGNGMMVHAGTSETGIVLAPMFAGVRSYRRVIF